MSDSVDVLAGGHDNDALSACDDSDGDAGECADAAPAVTCARSRYVASFLYPMIHWSSHVLLFQLYSCSSQDGERQLRGVIVCLLTVAVAFFCPPDDW